jgi:hypothetical protein
MMGARRGRRTSISGQFAPRLVEMLESFAYRVMSLSARRAIDRVEIELAHHGGNDNGKLPVTFQQFISYGIDRHSVAPAIREAISLGFLRITQAGCAGNREYRSPNLFRLTYRPAKGVPGDGSHEWKLFGSLGDAKQTASKARAETSTREYRPKKQKTRGGKHTSSVGKTPTETAPLSVGETPTTPQCGKPPLLSISRGGGRRRRRQARRRRQETSSSTPSSQPKPSDGGVGQRDGPSPDDPRRKVCSHFRYPSEPGGPMTAHNVWDEVIAEFATEEEAFAWGEAQMAAEAAAKDRKRWWTK